MNFIDPFLWKINDVSTWLRAFITNDEIIKEFQSESYEKYNIIKS